MEVTESSLISYGDIGGGGQARTVSVVETSSGCRHVFKRYEEEFCTIQAEAQLRALMRWRESLPLVDQEWIEKHAAWPLHVVQGSDRVAGCLMRVAPKDCWAAPYGKVKPRILSHLCSSTDKEENFNVPFRLNVLGSLLEGILWFHERKIILGDVALGNVLVATTGEVFFVDVDSFWLNGKCVFPFAENGAFETPFSSDSFSKETDLCKFALMCVKILSGNTAAMMGMWPQIDGLLGVDREIVEDLFAGRAHDRDMLKAMAVRWQRCYTETGEYSYKQKLMGLQPWTGSKCVFLKALPPMVDRCRVLAQAVELEALMGQSGASSPQVSSPDRIFDFVRDDVDDATSVNNSNGQTSLGAALPGAEQPIEELATSVAKKSTFWGLGASAVAMVVALLLPPSASAFFPWHEALLLGGYGPSVVSLWIGLVQLVGALLISLLAFLMGVAVHSRLSRLSVCMGKVLAIGFASLGAPGLWLAGFGYGYVAYDLEIPSWLRTVLAQDVPREAFLSCLNANLMIWCGVSVVAFIYGIIKMRRLGRGASAR